MSTLSHLQRLQAQTALPSAEAMLAEWKKGDENFAAFRNAAGQNLPTADEYQAKLEDTIKTFRALADVLGKNPRVAESLKGLFALRKDAFVEDALLLHQELCDNAKLPPEVKASHSLTTTLDNHRFLLHNIPVTAIIEDSASLRNRAVHYNADLSNKGNRLADTLANINGEAAKIEEDNKLPPHSVQAFLALDNSEFFTALTRAARPLGPYTVTDLLDKDTFKQQWNEVVKEVRQEDMSLHTTRAKVSFMNGKGLGLQ